MKNKFHLLLWLSVFILLSITIIVFSDTLALFETDSSGVVNSDIGKWIIKINNETITETVNETINVDNFRYSSNQHVQNGYIAPGGSAYFDLVVDATDCDVAVLYDISFDLESTNYDENITFEIENLSGGSIVRTDEYVYSGIISLAAIENDETYTIRVTIFWDDFEEYNESDTELGGVEDSLITIPIIFHAQQYLGETLVPYSG